MKGILAYTAEPFVSSDLVGDEHKFRFSGMETLVIGGNMPKVIAMYDNKMGYSTRVADLVAYVTMKQFEAERVFREARLMSHWCRRRYEGVGGINTRS